MSCGWAKASACRLQMTLSCAVLCHIVSLQYLSRSSLHCLAGLPCRLFLSYGLEAVTREVHRLSLRRLICPARDHFIFLTQTPGYLQKQPCHLPEETCVQLLCAASYDIWCRDLDTDQTSTEQTCGRTDQNGKKYAQHHIQR